MAKVLQLKKKTQKKEQRRQFETFEKFIRENCSVKTALYKEEQEEEK
jgi:hypothetical protein